MIGSKEQSFKTYAESRFGIARGQVKSATFDKWCSFELLTTAQMLKCVNLMGSNNCKLKDETAHHMC